MAYVEADLNYVVDTGTPPVMYVDWPEEGTKQFRHSTRLIGVKFMMRGQSPPNLALPPGFEMKRIPSEVIDFYDKDEVERVYNREVAAIIKKAIGGHEVVVFDHTFRTLNDAIIESKGTREPVKAVHNDYTDRSASQRVRDIMGDDRAEALLRERFAIVQTWHPINQTVLTEPFALADGRTIPNSNFVPLQRRYSYRTAETYHISFDPNHMFYYLPEMTPEETYIFKVYDTDRSAGVRFTAHTAFDDPTSLSDARPRESVESRALVFF